MLALYLTVLLALLWGGPVQAQRLNTQASTAQGLLAWWRAVPGLTGGRTWYDLTGTTPGTLTNMGTGSGWATPTRPGSSAELRFDGSNDYVVMPASPRLDTAALTVMVWVRVATFTDYGVIVASKNGTNREKSLMTRTLGRLAVYIQTAGGAAAVDPVSTSLSTNTWYHVAYTYDATAGLAVYVNCQLQGTYAAVGTLSAVGDPWYVGAGRGTADFLAMTVDEVRLYGRVLPAQELCAVYQDGRQGEPRLLPPSPLAALLGAVTGNTGGFLPFFQPAQ